MKNFRIQEFVCRCGCKMPAEVEANIEALVAEVLDPVRELFGKPIYVNSGHRCEVYNRKVGGVPRSQHIVGEAADISVKSEKLKVKSELETLAQLIVEQGRFDQLIIYPTLTSSSSDATRDSSSELGSPSLLPRFLHVSYKRSGANRHRVLRKTAKRKEK